MTPLPNQRLRVETAGETGEGITGPMCSVLGWRTSSFHTQLSGRQVGQEPWRKAHVGDIVESHQLLESS